MAVKIVIKKDGRKNPYIPDAPEQRGMPEPTREVLLSPTSMTEDVVMGKDSEAGNIHPRCDAAPMKFDNNLWRKVDAYIAKHDRHFNDKLAEYAISQMDNMDGTKHRWSVAEVQESMNNAGMYVHRPHTYADAAYAANMAYADFYPDVIHEPIDCLKYAYNLINDPDGYDAEIFNRWTADIYAKGINIDWNEFI